MLDATQPFGFGYLLPRGLLREKLSEIRRANIAILTRANLVSSQTRKQIRAEVHSYHPNLQWAEVFLSPKGWQSVHGEFQPLDILKDKKLFSFCGIGNPDAFQQTLMSANLNVLGCQVFEDHQHFSKNDIRQVVSQANQLSCDAIVCTAKDLVKLKPEDFTETPVFALTTDIEFLSGEEMLVEHLDELLPKLKNAG